MAAFWAPFLLVHLGGPDTITAFALEDNELWLRYLLGLFVQFGVPLNVFIRSWDGSPLIYLSIPIFVAGVVKYGERTWVLRSGPRSNYSKFMEEYSSKQAEGYKISTGTVTQGSKVVGRSQSAVTGSDDLDDVYYFFKTFKRLFADLILSFQDREQSQSIFTRQPWSKVLELRI
ncbi:uncharacterized protein LOC131309409 [Rhododendron vialii]|uniref:uncharacterized protein LOC131309409 n=1 Tax=Rhododendron vialii TaxID=182163 RepID=UPI00265ED41C|nr:uncharacterized protein LOC131309409 [Rhododendron vialii]